MIRILDNLLLLPSARGQQSEAEVSAPGSSFFDDFDFDKLIRAASRLHEIHTACLDTLISRAFAMTRDMTMTPRKLAFARAREAHVYAQLMSAISTDHLDAVSRVIREALNENVRSAVRARLMEHDLSSCTQAPSVGGSLQKSAEDRSWSHHHLDWPLVQSHRVVVHEERREEEERQEEEEARKRLQEEQVRIFGANCHVSFQILQIPPNLQNCSLGANSQESEDLVLVDVNYPSAGASADEPFLAPPGNSNQQVLVEEPKREPESESVIWCTRSEYVRALQELESVALQVVNESISDHLVRVVDCLHESLVGTLTRCLNQLEADVCCQVSPPGVAGTLVGARASPSRQSTLDRGTCVEPVPSTSRAMMEDEEEEEERESMMIPRQGWDDESSLHARNALRDLLESAYHVHINWRGSSSSSSLKLALSFREFWDKIRTLLTQWTTFPAKRLFQDQDGANHSNRGQKVIDSSVRKRVADEVIDGLLSDLRSVSRSICVQFRERVESSHKSFLIGLRNLEQLHSLRMARLEEERIRIRKVLAPRLARLALESTSLKDLLMHGMPQLGREIGRGQYGVVYACDGSWGGHSPIALKSVVPPDDKHWNDLAMEFYYTRSIRVPHERIVTIRGSIIDHSYGGGATPAVLFIMDRFPRDLYSALKTGLEWVQRLSVAIDVVVGIRFLHAQGLVHRDIKLKNVLLDHRNRAKITDLGFCKPEAMMSGSIVGTPIHMAPELFSGKYDSSVDVYAFGILFWYLCSGHVRLPYVFEQCANKDQLWIQVKKGARPERLPSFDPASWSLMSACWAGDPRARPHLGTVEHELRSMLSGSAKASTSGRMHAHSHHHHYFSRAGKERNTFMNEKL